MKKLAAFFGKFYRTVALAVVALWAAYPAYAQQLAETTGSALQLLNSLLSLEPVKATALAATPALMIPYAVPGLPAADLTMLLAGDQQNSEEPSILHQSNARLDVNTELLVYKYAEIIAAPPDEMENVVLYRFIDNWYGTRYKWGGSDNTGIDCSAFSQKLYSDIYGVPIERTARQQHRKSERFRHSDEAVEGDLVFFRTHRLRVSHVGVYLANGYFVHASRSQGVVISNLDDGYWHRRYAGCGRVEHDEKVASETDILQ